MSSIDHAARPSENLTASATPSIDTNQFQIGSQVRAARSEPDTLQFDSPFKQRADNSLAAGVQQSFDVVNNSLGRSTDNLLWIPQIPSWEQPQAQQIERFQSRGNSGGELTWDPSRPAWDQPQQKNQQNDRTEPQRPGDNLARKDTTASDSVTQKNQEYNLHRSVDHHKVPDARIYVPAGFDPSKPVNVIVYNHGWRDTAGSAMTNARLREQMAQAPPNSMLVVPAWQASEGAENSSEDSRFTRNFTGMLRGAMATQGRGLNDIGSISIVSHSAGYVPVERELRALEGTNLYDRINTVASLDTNYSSRQPAVDAWIAHNIQNGRFAGGEAAFLNLYGAGTDAGSRGQASRVQQMLRDRSINPRGDHLLGRDFNSPITFRNSGIPHGDFPRRFFGPAISRVSR